MIEVQKVDWNQQQATAPNQPEQNPTKYADKFKHFLVRRSFLIKVFFILLIEFVVTCVATFVAFYNGFGDNDIVQLFCIIIGLIVGLLALFLSTWAEPIFRKNYINVLLMLVIAICEAAILVGIMGYFTDLKYYVMTAMVIMGSMMLGLVVYSCIPLQFKFVRKRFACAIFITCWILSIGSISWVIHSLWLESFFSVYWIAACIGGAELAALYICFGVDMIFHGRSTYTMGPEDVWNSAVLLHPNIINLIFNILKLICFFIC